MHRLRRRRYGFHHLDRSPLARTVCEQIYALGRDRTVSPDAFNTYRSLISSEPELAVPERLKQPHRTASERIRAKVTVLDFVGQYVDLRPTPSGAIGLCPFHDDHHPSFGVNEGGNYWHCFAGCGGGSVIDLWIRWRGCDFTMAVGELARILL